jgi:hypothetical protein
MTYPYVFAASSYNDEKATKPTDFVRTIGILDYMLNTGKDLYYAHNLKCNVFVQLYKIDLAKKECEEAIKIDPANWPAQANLEYLYLRARAERLQSGGGRHYSGGQGELPEGA